MKLPAGPNFWTRLLNVSATYMLPAPSTATPSGALNWPSPEPLGAELKKEIAGRIKLLYAVIVRVRDVDVACAVHSYTLRGVKLAVSGAESAEFQGEGLRARQSRVRGQDDKQEDNGGTNTLLRCSICMKNSIML